MSDEVRTEQRPTRHSPRVPHHPAQAHGGSRREIAFSFEGRPVSAFEGDSVAAALFASGVRIFTRSFKYHRPRGLLCCAGRCPNCLMNVDGAPNVRTCVTPVQAGMRVRHQNAWPSLERDALSAIGWVERFLPVGFYYKTFIHPRALWPLYERVLKNVGGLGVVQRGSRPAGFHHEYRTTDVAVVGGGPAGMAAALAAAQAGCRVTLVEEQAALGGMLRGDIRTRCHGGEYAGASGAEIAARLTTALEQAGVTLWTGAAAFGAYEGQQLAVQRGKTLIELRYQRLVLASGAYERPALFSGNDLPGVMLGTGAQRMLRLYGVRPGGRAVVITTHDGGFDLAEELLAARIEVSAVADTRETESSVSSEAAQRLIGAGVPVLDRCVVIRARGRGRLASVDLSAAGRALRRFNCDLLCLSTGWEPALSLLAQTMPGAVEWDPARSVYAAGAGEGEVLVVGSAAGLSTVEECLDFGSAAGRAAATATSEIHHRDTETQSPNTIKEKVDRSPGRAEGETPPPLLPRPSSPCLPQGPAPVARLLPRSVLNSAVKEKRFVCFCEDVLEKDIAQAVEEGFDHIETLKRYSTASMGPCQGKMCRATVSELCAHYTGRTPDEVGMSRARPPAQPVTLGALGAAHDAPVRLTPMHFRHVALGARMMNLGEWKRPELYSTVEEECRAVRESVGLIDVSTLGKLQVVGRDAAALLEKVYTNRFADLRPGRVRYGVVCDDAGIILDDGTFARRGQERSDARGEWFITTTSGGVEAMEQWLHWWAAPGRGGRRPCAHVTNMTAGLAAVNVAGPRSRELLACLTDMDLSREAFPYLAAREGEVAGVPALILRIGFVGELGYELHYPAEYGVYLWDAILEAGKEFGIRPFGVEAQRVLRLEKQHLIVGHDTDALSNPLDASMPWIVKWEKEEFVGRRSLSLVQAAAARPEENGRQRLVGFTIEDAACFVPEGSQIVQEHFPVGRVTSYRVSPTLRKGIGLAWVPENKAQEGAEIEIAGLADAVRATVTLRPFYDPEGTRVRA
jgi:sarcosine oxidase subunit alpha